MFGTEAQTLLGMPTSFIRVPELAAQLQFLTLVSCQCILWDTAGDSSSGWVPVTHVGFLDSIPGVWLCPGLVLSLMGIWRTNQCMGYLFLSFLLSAFQANKYTNNLRDREQLSPNFR